MTLLFGDRADAIRKIQGLDKIRELENPFQSLDAVTLHQCPLGDQRLELANLCFGDWWGIAAAGGALFVGERAHNRRFDILTRTDQKSFRDF